MMRGLYLVSCIVYIFEAMEPRSPAVVEHKNKTSGLSFFSKPWISFMAKIACHGQGVLLICETYRERVSVCSSFWKSSPPSSLFPAATKILYFSDSTLVTSYMYFCAPPISDWVTRNSIFFLMVRLRSPSIPSEVEGLTFSIGLL